MSYPLRYVWFAVLAVLLTVSATAQDGLTASGESGGIDFGEGAAAFDSAGSCVTWLAVDGHDVAHVQIWRYQFWVTDMKIAVTTNYDYQTDLHNPSVSMDVYWKVGEGGALIDAGRHTATCYIP